jgi:SAM-dependent methyltransferase
MTREERGRLERRRSIFDQAAELYDQARPRYPPALFDDLAGLAGIGPGVRVLEVGPGTGQATVPLAERGCRLVAVELGPDLAAVARRNLAAPGRQRHPQLRRGARPFPPVRPRDVPPLRVGVVVHDHQLCRGAPHLLRPPRPRPESPGQPARLHRQLLDDGYGGRIAKRYLTELRVASTVAP